MLLWIVKPCITVCSKVMNVTFWINRTFRKLNLSSLKKKKARLTHTYSFE
jgi:hypothetical protein